MREPTKTFTYDSVFGTDTTQADVYNETARPIVDAVLEGYNGERERERERSSFISYFLLSLFLQALYLPMVRQVLVRHTQWLARVTQRQEESSLTPLLIYLDKYTNVKERQSKSKK